MGLFDTYEPAIVPTCPVCAEPMAECQGKDGPNALLVWKEDDRLPVMRRGDHVRDWLDGFPPDRFYFACWCPNDHPAEFQGEIEDGTWVRTSPAPVGRPGE